MLTASLPAIEAIEVLEVRVPRRARNRITTSYATLPDAHHVLVRAHADGLTGIGEAPAERWWTGEDAASVRNAIDRYLAPSLVGFKGGVRDAIREMDTTLAWNPYAKAAIEMALWDLLGRAANLPLCVLLGGSLRPLRVKYVIGMFEPARAREEALAARESGFPYLRLKVGGELESDLERIQAVVGVLREGERLGVDANGGWRLATALEALLPLQQLGVSFLEQPVGAQFPHHMAELTARSPIPVVAHESVFSIRDGFHAARNGLAHIWALTPSTHGGLVPTLDLLGLARAAGIPCLLGGTVELGVTTAFLAHIGAAFDTIFECPVPSDVIGPLYHERDVVDPTLTFEHGKIEVPARPGLGVELDDSLVDAVRVASG
jgi:L-alanine-DL-glutamate epimerase-like enolase superfamily enzyme